MPSNSASHQFLGLKVFLAVAAVVIIYSGAEVLLVIACSMLAAFPVVYGARKLSGKTGMPVKLWCALLLVGALVGVVLFFAFVGNQFWAQSKELVDRYPEYLAALDQQLKAYPAADRLAEQVQSNFNLSEMQLANRFKVLFSGVTGLLSSLLLFLALLLYLVFQHEKYLSALQVASARALGPGRSERVLNSCRVHLWGFLKGQIRAMALLAVLTSGGLWLLGMPLYLPLGMIAGVLAFVPVLGPFVSTIPAVVVAASEGGEMILWVLALYGGIQLLESNVITPMIQQDSSDLPPLLTLSFQAVIGTLAGPLGVLMAAPLAVLALVAGNEWAHGTEPSPLPETL